MLFPEFLGLLGTVWAVELDPTLGLTLGQAAIFTIVLGSAVSWIRGFIRG